MTAYIIVDIAISDPELYEEYKKQVPPTLERYGGRFLVRGGRIESLEGDWSPKRLVILEFDSSEQAKQWWSSAEYMTPKALRQAAAKTSMIVVQGVS